ncbi:regulatory protein RecX [Sphingobium nicotianae]|uniref:Regulatory protein RecX n=1 Tax=Sphingobium nicotianae TaxID=2782607 RepID=A0A9X1AHW4_9SPHN|nr:RecX family transcriptional regulator [Sphingobium nicotianae]MBT2185381.1 RecX family transcriptional regulator [Sphingobium nicotianae]
MAQKWRTRSPREKPAPRPLDAEALEALALHYVGRFATSRAKLVAYLGRKVRERGWTGDEPASVEMIAERLVSLRYVDDEAYATMKSGAMQRRGLGGRRIAEALRQDGIAQHLSAQASPSAAERWEAAHRLARRKRIGPFATERPDRALREKHLAAFIRAGHDLDLARAWVDAAPGELPPEPDRED